MNTPLQDIAELIGTKKLVQGADYKFDRSRAVLYLRTSRLFGELPHRDCTDADRWFVKLASTPAFLGLCRIARFTYADGTHLQSPALMINAEFLAEKTTSNKA